MSGIWETIKGYWEEFLRKRVAPPDTKP